MKNLMNTAILEPWRRTPAASAGLYFHFIRLAFLKFLAYRLRCVIDRVGGNFDLDTVQGQNTFRALLCSMVVHGWGNGMHPYHNPGTNQDGNAVEVRVSKDILMSMEDLQSLRYVKKDDQGRVKQALFEPDHNVRIRQQIDEILIEISRDKGIK